MPAVSGCGPCAIFGCSDSVAKSQTGRPKPQKRLPPGPEGREVQRPGRPSGFSPCPHRTGEAEGLEEASSPGPSARFPGEPPQPGWQRDVGRDLERRHRQSESRQKCQRLAGPVAASIRGINLQGSSELPRGQSPSPGHGSMPRPRVSQAHHTRRPFARQLLLRPQGRAAPPGHGRQVSELCVPSSEGCRRRRTGSFGESLAGAEPPGQWRVDSGAGRAPRGVGGDWGTHPPEMQVHRGPRVWRASRHGSRGRVRRTRGTSC